MPPAQTQLQMGIRVTIGFIIERKPAAGSCFSKRLACVNRDDSHFGAAFLQHISRSRVVLPADDGATTGLYNGGLFRCDLSYLMAKDIFVIEVYRGNHRQRRVYRIGCIEPAAKAYFEHSQFDSGASEARQSD